MSRSLILAALMSLAAAHGALARPVLWLCDTGSTEDSSIITPQIAVLYAPHQPGAMVNDALILSVVRHPLIAAVSRTPQSIALRWEVRRIPVAPGRTIAVEFHLTIDRKTLAAVTTARPFGGTETLTRRGLCRVAAR